MPMPRNSGRESLGGAEFACSGIDMVPTMVPVFRTLAPKPSLCTLCWLQPRQ